MYEVTSVAINTIMHPLRKTTKKRDFMLGLVQCAYSSYSHSQCFLGRRVYTASRSRKVTSCCCAKNRLIYSL